MKFHIHLLSKREVRVSMLQVLDGRLTKMLWWSQAHREGGWKVLEQGQGQVSAAAAERQGVPRRLPGGGAMGV